MRNLIFIPAIAMSYVFLSGWPEHMSSWMRSGIAAAIIGIALLLWRSTGDQKKGFFSSLRKPNLLDYLFAGITVLLLEFFFMTMFTYGPELGRDLSYRVEDWLREVKYGEVANEKEKQAPEHLRHGNDGNWLWNSHYQRQIPKRANHRPLNRPEVFITASSADQAQLMNRQQIYVRAFMLNHFDGDSWYLANPIKRVLDPSKDGFIRLKSRPPIQGFPVYYHTITHSYHDNGQNVLLGIHGARQVKQPYITRIAPDIYLLPPKKADQDGYDYEVASQPILLDQIISRGGRIIPGTPDEGLDAVYFDTLPDELLRAKMVAWLDDFAISEDNLAATLITIREALRERCEYSLKVENPENLSPLDNFLFGERKGYCEHFASATASLCRELGIPSRIAFGWAGGKYYEDSNQFMFVSADAHAWTEIYLKDYGWVVFDTTAPDQNRRQIAGSGETPPPLTEPPLEETPEQQYTEYNQSPWFMLACIMGLGTFALSLLVFLKFRSIPPRTRSGGTGITYVEPDYMRLFRMACARSGCPYPDHRTLRQQMIALEKRGILPIFSNVLLDYHNRVVYGDAERDSKAEKSLVRHIKLWQHQIKKAA
ncbi:Transglutaminase-like enzyme, putative cysteine protease [Rubritalea squalenifaciens DSM 18772]|uniref:Transglutaminase-like enzyme, putative cysteine protease n=1 Tax=Rubritalea squalenifaciens DSM 18772 TaxID=1123071 RepID=A0A1M6B7K5_9BACT|nr:transglutaminase domain-containing protein [Rubritalea squalenifaciens]SHI44729.1 Transglutaminase-like enzyme, putative cysteine protease [Rubritalea squalenifaciens DSM 18772]